MLKSFYRKVVPARLRRAIRALTMGEPPLVVRYELAAGWPEGNGPSSWAAPTVASRLRGGLETFDFERLKREPQTALSSPIVRDNLALLERTGLTEAALLDFGCGNALYRLILAHHAPTARWKYTGVDVNGEVIEWCRAEHAGARFETTGVDASLPFRDDEFDVALASGVIQCIENYETVLSELRRVARFFVVASRIPVWKHEPTRVVRQDVSHAWGRETHFIRVFKRDEMEESFARAGFSILHRDYGSEVFQVPGVAEPAIHNHYLLRRV